MMRWENFQHFGKLLIWWFGFTGGLWASTWRSEGWPHGVPLAALLAAAAAAVGWRAVQWMRPNFPPTREEEEQERRDGELAHAQWEVRRVHEDLAELLAVLEDTGELGRAAVLARCHKWTSRPHPGEVLLRLRGHR